MQKLSAERSRWLATQSNISRRVIKTRGDLTEAVSLICASTDVYCLLSLLVSMICVNGMWHDGYV